eukprot:TRINITY_DN7405_c0_g1_i1.p1 TRINITY_DN7405_c0_g1~~TRINITY_DN7405_c0_g1_i1.p1  ORF type:complete len:238 (-),score=21.66 TRINITY_DN7405_c0_g1_i1:621-1280(-)
MVFPPPPALAGSSLPEIATKRDEPEKQRGLSRSHSGAMSVSSGCRSASSATSVSENSDVTSSSCELSSMGSSSVSSACGEEDKGNEHSEVNIKKQIATLMSRSPEHFRGRSAQDVYNMIPTHEDGSLTSVGSVLHASGSCMPCLFFYASTCNKGASCGYCHVPHEDVKKKRSRARGTDAKSNVAVTEDMTKLTERQKKESGSGFNSDAQRIVRFGRMSL